MTRLEPPLEERDIDEKSFGKSNRRAFLWAGLLGGLGVWQIASISSFEKDRGIPWLLRKINSATDSFWKTRFNKNATAPNVSPLQPIRVNGYVGLEKAIDVDNWKLQVRDPNLLEPRYFTLNEIKALPAVAFSFEFKCIEGWSRNVSCKGVRVSEFMNAFGIGAASAYCGMKSINAGYYVSMPIESLMHEQTILCWEMNGEPLSPVNGAPLRLVTAVHYGVKSIKQLGSMEFMQTLPPDYWAERGYGDTLGL